MKAGIRGINPIPREVGHRDRRDSCPRGGGKRQRRHIADDDRCTSLLENAGFRLDAAVELPVEGGGLTNGFSLVELQAIDLDDAGVGLARLHVD